MFANIIKTVIDVKEKIKNNLKARLDLEEHYRRPLLYLILEREEKYKLPKAIFKLNKTKSSSASGSKI